jgi:hypothetical protein
MGTSGTTSRPPAAAGGFRVSYQGKVFGVSLKALRGDVGLVASPVAFLPDTRVVLNPLDSPRFGDYSGLQLFGWVLKAHTDRELYELRWDKLVSSVGVRSMARFLSQVLSVQLSGDVTRIPHSDDDMVYYSFAERRILASRSGPAHLGGDSAPLLPMANEGGGATPRPVRREDLVGSSASPEGPVPSGSGLDVARGNVSLYGVQVSEEEWGRLENLHFSSGQHRTSASASVGGQASGVDGRGGHAAPVTSVRRGMSGLLRKLAKSLSTDEDPQ